MLQQTQAETVVSYYVRFLDRFPDVFALANASLDEVLHLFSGLGYYRRALYLHQTAKMIATDYKGLFPQDPKALQSLPGIGRSTAAAIAVFAFGKKAAILDGNVKRTLSRVFLVEEEQASKRDALLWDLAVRLLPEQDIKIYTQGLMDFGATICTPKTPLCVTCPMVSFCKAYAQNKVLEFPKQKALRPKTSKTFLVPLIRLGHAIYLEKRDAYGIWAHMWMMPLFEDEKRCETFLQPFGIVQREKLLPVRHELTHIRLDLKPFLFVAHADTTRVGEKNAGFFTLSESKNLAMPKPGRFLLDLLEDARK